MRLLLAIFLVVLGLSLASWALFLSLGYPGLLLMGGLLTAAAGLLYIPVDRSSR